ncbi:MAG TPA: type I restriction enzyme HsdR N-terminal domain-containing protein [Chitinophagaceae bacterium]|nr:type I restriction enzyme HsdR N-terminal domain-containing protein [Chitinophagaceae bacterium]
MNDNRFKTKTENGKTYIFDSNRKKYVVLTDEEWVRQNILFYLVHEMKYPQSLISVEKQIKVGSRNRRYDIVIYKETIPWLIIECKRESEVLNQQVLSQLLSYNSTLRVAYLTITNGKQVMTYDIAQRSWNNSFPTFDENK